VTRYRARPRVGCYPGCVGCSIPLLVLAVGMLTALLILLA